eukprot:UN07580
MFLSHLFRSHHSFLSLLQFVVAYRYGRVMCRC